MTTPARRLRRARRTARLLDEAFELPVVGKRIGIDGLLGLVPVAGDWLTYLLSLHVVYEAYRAGVPKHALLRMLANVTLDAVVGSVPVVGDVVDVVWKANRRNVRLFERHVDAD